MEDNWANFLSANSGCLFLLDSNEVIEAAKQNAELKKATKKIRKEAGEKVNFDIIPENESFVFIEELTKGRGKKQRDVGKWAAKNYFGDAPDLILTHIDDQGQRGDKEIRKVSSKGSVNFAIDLDASKGLMPISGQMPIAIFIRTSPKNFFYHIISANSAHYLTISSYLNKEVGKVTAAGNAKRLKKEMPIEKLREIWPAAPFWNMADDE